MVTTFFRYMGIVFDLIGFDTHCLFLEPLVFFGTGVFKEKAVVVVLFLSNLQFDYNGGCKTLLQLDSSK